MADSANTPCLYSGTRAMGFGLAIALNLPLATVWLLMPAVG
jgi:hypothetical protein